ncbi:MAG: bifunctional N(6)-L-threonylcarbamoyladenine synthase/serine/threonine protein kinase [Candidatus Methanofastidiosum sp.]|jgi:universal protein Kae1|nr:bifunctional N(6)-L-threonylcarbamoyladenine synthase/serine/threonine protein kinase [Methanofastidiosum sp.]HNV93674.1 bifunctional N(6)-L-threonylcarbamoyladenine synthase/serine/threonine protein kinase [Methanofastidiosum sp.]HOT84508.1 bifunctional N(6)-L-threonylcarbamoyladenine synthase/serine/threonine protein kinase [Methanofastidiosum sp.]HPU91361.1 bifunctional N(6)-L-threonylcarbamoyladenine synthase/serine/threonine protein kinase [Methanofastidiosum sp.]HQF89347.1 bifunctional
MISLGIEGTAHTLGVGVVSEKAVLSNVIDSYCSDGGIHPREAADHHASVIGSVMQKSLSEAEIKKSDIDLISFSMGPGLGPCLRIVASAARSLSINLNIPVIGVNHCVAHVEIGRFITGARDPVTLYVSGGNTQILAYAEGKYRVFGETLDVGIGNMQDTFGRELGIGFPCGKQIDDLSRKGKKYLQLPYTIKGMDFSFSGLLTESIRKLKTNTKEDVTFSLMETAYSLVVEASERAMSHTEKNELLLTGGVASSKRLKEMCSIMCEERDAKIFVPPPALCRDNGAMIAYQGLLEYTNGKKMNIEDTIIKQKWRTDEVEVNWI